MTQLKLLQGLIAIGILLIGCTPLTANRPPVTSSPHSEPSTAPPLQATVSGAPTVVPEVARAPVPQPRLHGFDASISSLPPRFTGDDIVRVRTSLASLNAQRGEFETTADHNARLQVLRDREIIPDRRLDSIYAFSVPYSPVGRYDADRGVFRLTYASTSDVPFWQVFGSVARVGLFVVRVLEKREDTYIGQNAYGASARIFRTRERVISIRACGQGVAPCPVLRQHQLDMRIPPERAAAAQGRMRLLIVGSLSAPYVGRETESGSQVTFSNPFDRMTEHQTVLMRVSELLIYNHDTGEILHRIRL